jgi:hypothetical protein
MVVGYGAKYVGAEGICVRAVDRDCSMPWLLDEEYICI